MSFFKNLTGLNKPMNVNVMDASEQLPAATPADRFTRNAAAEAMRDDEAGEAWLTAEDEEGQLAIDVYQTPQAIVVKSTIAGVKPDDIDIAINNDMLTIRGTRRQNEQVTPEDYFYQECYWGGFSRSVILPVEVKTDAIEASMENGVLTVTLPKARAAKQIAVKVTEQYEGV